MEKEKQRVINKLRKYGNISKAVDKAGISRQKYYRWYWNDENFRAESQKARAEFLQSTI